MAAPPDSPRRALFEEAVQAGAPPDVVTRWLAAAAAPQASPLAAHGAGRLANDVTALEEAPLDARSYLLGQRSALEFAFQEALPQRTALGALQTAVRDLRATTASDSAAVRGLQAGAAALEALLVAAEGRLAELERRRVARLEASLGDCRAALAALRADVARLEARRSGLLEWAATSGRGALAAAAARLVLCEPDAAAMRSGDEAARKRAERRRTLGPFLVVLSVEVAYRAGCAAARPLPSRVRALASPLGASLALARRVAWAAAAVLAFARAKDAAHAASDALLAVAAPRVEPPAELEMLEMTPLQLGAPETQEEEGEADGAMSSVLRARRAAADSTTPQLASPNYSDP